MNTGIQDAVNLGWKLALVVDGNLAEHCLDSYEEERRNVAADVLRTSRAATEGIEQYSQPSPQERERVIKHKILPENQRLQAARNLQEVDIDYHCSFLSVELSGEFLGGPHAGCQAPDAFPIMNRGQCARWYTLPADINFRLLLFTGSKEAAGIQNLTSTLENSLESFRSWLDVYLVLPGNAPRPDLNGSPGLNVIRDFEGTMHRKYCADKTCMYLLRPDGYIAYRSTNINSLSLYTERLGLYC